MKRSIVYILFILSFCSCSEEGDLDVIISDILFTALSVNKESLAFDANGGQQTLTISSNESWDCSWPSNWISVSKNAGTGTEDITITANPNPLAEIRTGIITIATTNGAKSVTISLTQSYITTLSLDKESLTFEVGGGQQTLNIKCNDGWRCSWSMNWIGVSKNTGTGNEELTVTAYPNTTSYNRSGNISFVTTNGEKTVTINITQKKSNIPDSGHNPPPDTGN